MNSSRLFILILLTILLISIMSAPAVHAASTGYWQLVGTGDCPGRDVANSRGAKPVSARCTEQFLGRTAVCWNNECTYKNIETGACVGGANPGRMYTCKSSGESDTRRGDTRTATGHWQLVGTGDCPGRDVANSRGSKPAAARCNEQSLGQTAVCWNNECTYKNIETNACVGGGNPGRMYTCKGSRESNTYNIESSWRLVGTGDCPGRDVANSKGPNPDPKKCNRNFKGQTAVCWGTGCTYKNIATESCTGGASPGRMYTCDGE